MSLAELAEAQEQWDGRLVHTRGTVRTFAEPLHYWIEDADHNRVELLPHEEVAALVGTPVEVTGRFTFREGEGRRIAVDEVSVLRSGPG